MEEGLRNSLFGHTFIICLTSFLEYPNVNSFPTGALLHHPLSNCLNRLLFYQVNIYNPRAPYPSFPRPEITRNSKRKKMPTRIRLNQCQTNCQLSACRSHLHWECEIYRLNPSGGDSLVRSDPKVAPEIHTLEWCI